MVHVLSQAYPAPVKLRWSSNAHLDLEGKPVSSWKLKENSRREWESASRSFIYAPVMATLFRGPQDDGGGLAAIASRSTEL
jgi:hypothetical protein